METNLTLSTMDADISPLGFIWGMLRSPLHTLADLARDNGDIAHVKMPKRDFYLLTADEFHQRAQSAARTHHPWRRFAHQ